MSGNTEDMTVAQQSRLMTRILDGLVFPAQRWQIVTQAELYGADSVTIDRLRHLPQRAYADCGEVTRTLVAH